MKRILVPSLVLAICGLLDPGVLLAQQEHGGRGLRGRGEMTPRSFDELYDQTAVEEAVRARKEALLQEIRGMLASSAKIAEARERVSRAMQEAQGAEPHEATAIVARALAEATEIGREQSSQLAAASDRACALVRQWTAEIDSYSAKLSAVQVASEQESAAYREKLEELEKSAGTLKAQVLSAGYQSDGDIPSAMKSQIRKVRIAYDELNHRVRNSERQRENLGRILSSLSITRSLYGESGDHLEEIAASAASSSRAFEQLASSMIPVLEGIRVSQIYGEGAHKMNQGFEELNSTISTALPGLIEAVVQTEPSQTSQQSEPIPTRTESTEMMSWLERFDAPPVVASGKEE